MDETKRRFVREILDRYFPDITIRASDVSGIDVQAFVVDFPRSMYCGCTRCRSSYVVKSVLGNTLTVITAEETFSVFIPSDEGTLEHI